MRREDARGVQAPVAGEAPQVRCGRGARVRDEERDVRPQDRGSELDARRTPPHLQFRRRAGRRSRSTPDSARAATTTMFWPSTELSRRRLRTRRSATAGSRMSLRTADSSPTSHTGRAISNRANTSPESMSSCGSCRRKSAKRGPSQSYTADRARSTTTPGLRIPVRSRLSATPSHEGGGDIA